MIHFPPQPFRRSVGRAALFATTAIASALLLSPTAHAGPLEDALDGGVGTYVTPDGSNAAWGVVRTTVRSGTISNGQTSRISVTVDGPGIVSFYWNIDAFNLSNPQNQVIAFSDGGFDFDSIGSVQLGFSSESLRVDDGAGKVISWTYQQHDDPLQGTGTAGLDFVFFFPERKRIASDSGANRNFGTATAMAGSLALVGAFAGTGNVAPSGTAYLFDVTDPLNPVERSKLQASDGALFDAFGISVALCGNLALVGAIDDDDHGDDSGSAYLFDISDPDNPVERAKLTASDGADDDSFGDSVALCGHLALVGASRASSSQGKAYLFDVSDPANPVEMAKLTASDGAGGDRFGISVALDGALALVGAFRDDGSRGAAYLFDVSDPTSPVETAKLTGSDDVGGDFFGESVALSGDRALVGSAQLNSGRTGAAYLYDVSDPAAPVERSKITDSDGANGDQFGFRVSLSGDLALIGTPLDHATAFLSEDSGSAHLFDVSDPDNPFERAELTAHDITANENFGQAVALFGNRSVVGVQRDDSNAGSVYFHDLRSAAADRTEISPAMHTIGSGGGAYPLRLNAVGAWNAASDQGFATIDTAAGNGNAGIAVTIAPNPTTADRMAKVTVNGVEHTVMQKGRPAPPKIITKRKVKYGGRTAKIKGTVTGGFPIISLKAKASGGAKAKVRGASRFVVKVKKAKRRVTRVKLTATDSDGGIAKKTVKAIKK